MKDAILYTKHRLYNLLKNQSFSLVLELISILHDISISRNMRLLYDDSFINHQPTTYNSRRVEKIMLYINQNFEKNITLSEAAKIASMSNVAFSRFFKLRIGKMFVDTVNDILPGHAARILIDTTHSITEIAYKCGFNNISNFNRIFKKKKECTPREFRETYATLAAGIRRFI